MATRVFITFTQLIDERVSFTIGGGWALSLVAVRKTISFLGVMEFLRGSLRSAGVRSKEFQGVLGAGGRRYSVQSMARAGRLRDETAFFRSEVI